MTVTRRSPAVTEAPLRRWVPPTHERHLVTRFPTMGSEWVRLADSGKLQRYLSGQNSSLTLTIHGGPNRPDSAVAVTQTVSVPPRSIILVEDAKVNGNAWWFVSVPVEPKCYSVEDSPEE